MKVTLPVQTLLIAEGLEYFLGKVAHELTKTDNQHIDIVFSSCYRKEEPRGISNLEDEIQDIPNIKRSYILRKREGFRDIAQNFMAIRKNGYKKVLISNHNLKSYIILLAFFITSFPYSLKIDYTVFDYLQKRKTPLNGWKAFDFIARKLFCLKAINSLAIRFCRLFSSSFVLGYPDYMVIESTNLCNLKCRVCKTGTNQLERPLGIMSLNHFEKIMKECGRYLRQLRLYFMGEPLLHKDIWQMIRLAKKSGVMIVEINTNGNFILNRDTTTEIIESGVDIIIVSLDGMNQETYEKYRQGGKIDKVLHFMKQIVNAKEQKGVHYPILIAQMIIMRENEKQIEQYKTFVKEIGADGWRFIMFNPQMAELDFNSLRYFIPNEHRHRNYQVTTGGLVFPRGWGKKCPHLWDSMVITWDGRAVPCCSDYTASVTLGNVFDKKRIWGIWNGSAYREFRKRINKIRSQIPLCRNCPE
jgi:radical SAM protein with 4Fe4S-binding SPASM domain